MGSSASLVSFERPWGSFGEDQKAALVEQHMDFSAEQYTGSSIVQHMDLLGEYL